MMWPFARRFADGLSSLRDQAPAGLDHSASIPREEDDLTVAPSSPARLLAASLTDPETRDEWEREWVPSIYSSMTKYTNPRREITVSRRYGYGLGSGESIYTPFSLSRAEKKIVREALEAFDRRKTLEREREALARLIAPAAGLEARKGGDAKQGSTRSAKARSRKGAAQKDTPHD